MFRDARGLISALLIGVCSLAFVTGAQAQQRCSRAMVRGTYALSCNAHINIGEGEVVNLVPGVLLGTVIFDEANRVSTGILHGNIGGTPTDVDITGGPGVVNADCTASIDLNVSIDGEPLPTANIPGVVLDGGNRIRAFSPIIGTVGLCLMERISLD